MTDVGRAGRIRVERRLVMARHGADLLDRKRQIMTDELEHLQLDAARALEEWETCARDAARWSQRVASLDGHRGIRGAAPTEPAELEITWGTAMGVEFPEDARCTIPPVGVRGGSSALVYAVAAHEAALAAGARCAAAERAVHLVQAELVATRTRQRAVEHRWIPRLERELATIRRRLDEQELEEALRLRWAADSRPDVRGHGTSTTGQEELR